MEHLGSHIIIGLLWTAYCLLHSVLALESLKQHWKPKPGDRVDKYRLFYNAFALLSLVAIVLYQVTVPSPFVFTPAWWNWIAGGILILSGIIIMTICIGKYFLQMSGLQKQTELPSDQLIINGVHQWVRHPLYFGTFLFIWGGWLVYPSLSFLVADSVITLYTLIGIHIEEKKLVKEFGEAYRQYQKKVPMILPFRVNRWSLR
jgi:methanethiol S-methyltransferase